MCRRWLRASPRSLCKWCSSSSSTSGPAGSSVEADTVETWLHSHCSQALSAGRVTKESYDYFSSLSLSDDQRVVVQECRKILGNVAPEKLTKYQQQMMSENMLAFASNIVSERIRKVYDEQAAEKRFREDGTPTGQSYWFEQPLLVNDMVPSYIKEEILEEMKQSRSPDSPAFMIPSSEEQNVPTAADTAASSTVDRLSDATSEDCHEPLDWRSPAPPPVT